MEREEPTKLMSNYPNPLIDFHTSQMKKIL